MPSTSRCGVDSALPKVSLPLASSKTETSVKVPPTSAASLNCDGLLMNGPLQGNSSYAAAPLLRFRVELDHFWLILRGFRILARPQRRRLNLSRRALGEFRDNLRAHIVVE